MRPLPTMAMFWGRCLRLLQPSTGNNLSKSRHALSACRRASSSSGSVEYPIQLSSVSPNHAALYEESLSNPQGFWGDLARRRLRWFKEFDQVMNCDMEQGKISWFNGGKINVSGIKWCDMHCTTRIHSFVIVNLLDRHAEKHPHKAAIIWEQDALGSSQRVSYWLVCYTTLYCMNSSHTQVPSPIPYTSCRCCYVVLLCGVNMLLCGVNMLLCGVAMRC